MPASHLRLLGGLELGATIGDYAFVHAGVRPGRPLAKQTEADLLWIRKGFLDVEGPFEKVIVHGHTWTDDQPRLSRHRLSLDTGSYATGVLTAVRLEDGEVAVLQVRRPPLAG
jgi:serine/threonine protein phosphatase 1